MFPQADTTRALYKGAMEWHGISAHGNTEWPRQVLPTHLTREISVSRPWTEDTWFDFRNVPKKTAPSGGEDTKQDAVELSLISEGLPFA